MLPNQEKISLIQCLENKKNSNPPELNDTYRGLLAELECDYIFKDRDIDPGADIYAALSQKALSIVKKPEVSMHFIPMMHYAFMRQKHFNPSLNHKDKFVLLSRAFMVYQDPRAETLKMQAEIFVSINKKLGQPDLINQDFEQEILLWEQALIKKRPYSSVLNDPRRYNQAADRAIAYLENTDAFESVYNRANPLAGLTCQVTNKDFFERQAQALQQSITKHDLAWYRMNPMGYLQNLLESPRDFKNLQEAFLFCLRVHAINVSAFPLDETLTAEKQYLVLDFFHTHFLNRDELGDDFVRSFLKCTSHKDTAILRLKAFIRDPSPEKAEKIKNAILGGSYSQSRQQSRNKGGETPESVNRESDFLQEIKEIIDQLRPLQRYRASSWIVRVFWDLTSLIKKLWMGFLTWTKINGPSQGSNKPQTQSTLTPERGFKDGVSRSQLPKPSAPKTKSSIASRTPDL